MQSRRGSSVFCSFVPGGRQTYPIGFVRVGENAHVGPHTADARNKEGLRQWRSQVLKPHKQAGLRGPELVTDISHP